MDDATPEEFVEAYVKEKMNNGMYPNVETIMRKYDLDYNEAQELIENAMNELSWR